MACGIYKITNVINSKFYIGSSRRLIERRNEHFSRFKNNKGNSIIKSAIQKYGIENFKFEVLEYFYFWKDAKTKYIDEILTSREQYYVDVLNPEYNIKIKDVTSMKGIALFNKSSTRDTISKREMIRRNRELGIHKSKKYVEVYDPKSLTDVETIYGVRNCAEKYKKSSTSIYKICKHGVLYSYKDPFVFCYSGDDINTKIKNRKTIKRYIRKNTNLIIQVDKNNNFIKEFRTMQEAEKELNLYKGSISRVLSGKYKHVKNYYFKPKNKFYEML